MEINDIFANTALLQSIATAFAVVVALVVIYVVTMWGGAKGAEYYRVIRGQVPAILEQFDEPTDSVPALIDRYLDRLVEAQWDKMISVMVPVFVDSVTKILDQRLEKPVVSTIHPSEDAIADPNPPAWIESQPLSKSVK